MPTTWRMLERIDQGRLPGVLAARAAARERAWAAGAGPDVSGLLAILDLPEAARYAGIQGENQRNGVPSMLPARLTKEGRRS